MNTVDEIPANRKPYKPKAVKTVGSLIKLLQTLPPRTKIHQGFSDGVVPVVYNAGHPSKHVSFEEDDGMWTTAK